MTQTNTDADWMQLALTEARQAASAGEVPVGAVVVKDGRLLATGRNAPIAGHDPTAHAEIVALRAAAQTLGNYRLEGCSLYVTLEPCAMCSGAMLHARLDRVVFGAPDSKTGAAGGALDLFAVAGLNHRTQVSGGVLADECARLLQGFFQARRSNPHPLREDALRTPAHRFDGLHHPTLETRQRHFSKGPPWNGLHMHVTDTGPDVPHAIVVLHGPWGWGRDGEALALALQACGVRAILPDAPGFGRSDKPKKNHVHTLAWHKACVQAMTEQLGLRRVLLLAPAVPVVWALANALVTADPRKFVGVLGWQPAEFSAAACPTLDAPFPDQGHRAGPRAWAQQAFASPEASCTLPDPAQTLKLCNSMARWAAPAWTRWGGVDMPSPTRPALDDQGLADILSQQLRYPHNV